MQFQVESWFRSLLVVVGVAACAPALDWRDVRAPGSAASLLFPCKPAAQSREVALAGPAVSMSLQACTTQALTFGLASADVVDPARVGPALRALRTAAAANVGAVTEAAAAWPVPGATPNESSGRVQLSGRAPEGKPLQMQLLLFAHGTRVFQASVLGESVADETVQTFYSSIRFPR